MEGGRAAGLRGSSCRRREGAAPRLPPWREREKRRSTASSDMIAEAAGRTKRALRRKVEQVPAAEWGCSQTREQKRGARLSGSRERRDSRERRALHDLVEGPASALQAALSSLIPARCCRSISLRAEALPDAGRGGGEGEGGRGYQQASTLQLNGDIAWVKAYVAENRGDGVRDRAV